ncbi:hypothetical protein JD523_12195 [Aeromonas enteropelogenes]|uniref:hypothetical protein n=1 Tax=Aeromonas enteropelogenes TaxID=29489 RepID=UPI00191F3F19|nr:hypothetical protein [Aeromonas enteropelogenes]MBL0521657.1 hypothetical protein [Aeromonas enteropelogenes]
MTDLFSKLEALQGELPSTPHTYKPLTAQQYEALESQIYRMGPQIDGTPAWSPDLMLEWLQQLTPHIRGVAIAMMRRVYRPERVGLPPLPQAIPGRKKVLKQINKSTTNQPMIPLLSADGRTVGKRHMVDGLAPVIIDQSGTIRCANTGHTLWIAPDSPTDRANPGTAEQLNPIYKAALHQVVADHRS